MALYVDEEEIWKCPSHPSKRRRHGICPLCLRERLVVLCPDCASLRPCASCPISSTSSSSFSSISRFFTGGDNCGVDTVGRVSNLINNEPAFRRSRSLAIPFIRSRSRVGGESDNTTSVKVNTASFWFKRQKSKKSEIEEDEAVRRRMMRKSRSVAAVVTDSGCRDVRSASKGRGWNFPSPMKVFRQPKIPKVVQERPTAVV